MRAVAPVFAPLARRSLRRTVIDIRSIDDVLDAAYSFRVGGITIRPMQVRSELQSLARMVADRKPKVVVEIGTANGGTLFVLARTASPEALLISVDLPGGDFGGGYPRWKRELYRTFASQGQQLVLIQRDSHDEETIAEVQDILDGRRVDVLFVDGDHSYEGVRRDFEAYSPLVADDGIVAFHDIVPENPALKADVDLLPGQVPRFWNELRSRYRSTELVADWKQGAMGIGVLPWPPSEEREQSFSASSEAIRERSAP
jgi:cephalosporin hydroxylase